MLKPRYIISLLIIMIFASIFVAAQDDELDTSIVENELRLVCINTIGCLYTPLNDTALDTQFSTELARYEAADIEPDGVWEVFTEELIICDDIQELGENSDFIMYLIEADETSDDIIVTDSYGLSPSTYQRIGEGVYVGEFVLGDANTYIQYLEFLVMVDETTMRSIGIGGRIIGDQSCTQASLATYTRLGDG